MKGLCYCDLMFLSVNVSLSVLLFFRQQNMSTDTTGHILCVIGHVAKHLPKSTSERLIGAWPWGTAEGKAGSCLPASQVFLLHKQLISLENGCFLCVVSFSGNIKCWLRESPCPLEVISPAVEALQKLCHAYADVPEEAQVWLQIHLLK